jgi:hypothetical protein
MLSRRTCMRGSVIGSALLRRRKAWRRLRATGVQQCLSHVPIVKGHNRLNLYKIVGRKAGSQPDYAFSSAMKEADFVWDERSSIAACKAHEVVPGNNMKPYGGLPSGDDRKDHRLPCSTATRRKRHGALSRRGPSPALALSAHRRSRVLRLTHVLDGPLR